MLKKSFLILFTLFSVNVLFSQNYCDCFNAKISNFTSNSSYISWYFDISDDTLCTSVSPTNMISVFWETIGENIHYSDSIWWHNIEVFDPNNFITSMTVIVNDTTINGSVFQCDFCYTALYNNNEWEIESIDCQTLSITEIENSSFNKKYYDVLGREFDDFNSIPIGSMYIANKKQYLKNN